MFTLLFGGIFLFLDDVQHNVIASHNPGIEPKFHNLIMNEMPCEFHTQADRQVTRTLRASVSNHKASQW